MHFVQVEYLLLSKNLCFFLNYREYWWIVSVGSIEETLNQATAIKIKMRAYTIAKVVLKEVVYLAKKRMSRERTNAMKGRQMMMN